MPYKVQKLIHDKRNTTCGFRIPNGGFYLVLEMTFENHQQLTNISNRAGWTVDLVEGPVGMFDGSGYEIDPDSLEIHKISKQVTGYKRIQEAVRKRLKDESGKIKVTPVMHDKEPAQHVSLERQGVIDQCRMVGINNVGVMSTQSLKNLLARQGRTAQQTLATQ